MNPFTPTRRVHREWETPEYEPVPNLVEAPKHYINFCPGNTDDPWGSQDRLNRKLAEGWKVFTYYTGPPIEPSINVPGVNAMWFMLERIPTKED